MTKWNDPMFKYKKTLKDEEGRVLVQCGNNDKVAIVPEGFSGVVSIPRGNKTIQTHVNAGDHIIVSRKKWP